MRSYEMLTLCLEKGMMKIPQVGRVTARDSLRKVRTPQSTVPGKSRSEATYWIGPQKQTADGFRNCERSGEGEKAS